MQVGKHDVRIRRILNPLQGSKGSGAQVHDYRWPVDPVEKVPGSGPLGGSQTAGAPEDGQLHRNHCATPGALMGISWTENSRVRAELQSVQMADLGHIRPEESTG